MVEELIVLSGFRRFFYSGSLAGLQRYNVKGRFNE